MPSNKTRLKFFLDPMLGMFGIAKDSKSISDTLQKVGTTIGSSISASNTKQYSESVFTSWYSVSELQEIENEKQYIEEGGDTTTLVIIIAVLLVIALIILAIWTS